MESKRLEITERALNLFCQFGIKSVSMDDMARELGMSKKTLYQLIDDKNKLVEATLEMAIEKDAELMSIFKREDLNAIEHYFEFKKVMEPHIGQYKPTMMYDLKKYYPGLLNSFKERQKKFVIEAYTANLKQGKREGNYHDDINEDIIARILLTHHLFTFDESVGVFTNADLNNLEFYSEIYKYHFRGICTEKGLKEVERLFCENDEKQK